MKELIIIGAGPAGLTASIYASRYGLDHLVIGEAMGGTITWAHKVSNFPAVADVSGSQLAERMIDQAKSLGAEIISKEVVSLEKSSQGFILKTSDNQEFQTKSVIVATGTKRRELGVRGEKEFLGKGVSYCCTCDAAFYKNKEVAVVGGANAACSGAIHVAQFAKKVYLLYRKSALRAEEAWIKELKEKENVEILYETNVLEIKGGQTVESILLSKEYKGKKELEVSGIFIEIGGVPAATFLKNTGVKIDEAGYVIANEKMQTNIEGIFSAGDINSSNRELQQVITACAEGAIAAYSAYNFLKK